MPFNADDYTQPPFTNGIMTLTNDECVKVKDKCQEIKDAYKSSPANPDPSMMYVVSAYNESNNFKEGINGDTYNTLEKYNPEVNTQGIAPDAPNGIVPEPTPEEPTETPEEPSEGETSPDEENPPNEPETAPADEVTEQPTEEA